MFGDESPKIADAPQAHKVRFIGDGDGSHANLQSHSELRSLLRNGLGVGAGTGLGVFAPSKDDPDVDNDPEQVS